MKAIYSILQFRQSLLKDEIFNIGIAYGFIQEQTNKVHFQMSDYKRLKNIYPQLNERILNAYMMHIQKMIDKTEFSLQENVPLDRAFRLYLRKNVLLEDATALQFTYPKIITNITDENVIENRYSKQLLSFTA